LVIVPYGGVADIGLSSYSPFVAAPPTFPI